MYMSDVDIKKAIKKGEIKIEPLSEEQIGPASIDLTLDNIWWFPKKKMFPVDLKKVGWEELMEKKVAERIVLKPGELCLGITKERITLAENIIGKLEGRSRYARVGLSVHITSALVQPGVSNHQVLEIVNNAPFPVVLHEGMRVSQIVFAKTKSKTSKPYRKVGKIAVKQ
ncbi:MAG: dCTP deaminase [Candidatus Anstonellales archaeon]